MQRGAREYICFPSLHTHQADGQQEQRGGSECESIARGAIVLGVCGRICFLCLHTQTGRRPGQHPRGGKRTRPCGPAHLALQQASLQCGQHARCGLFSALLTASVCPAFPGCPQARQRRNIPQPAPLRVELQRQWRQPVCRARERRERERDLHTGRPCSEHSCWHALQSLTPPITRRAPCSSLRLSPLMTLPTALLAARTG